MLLNEFRNKKRQVRDRRFFMVPGQGFEPRLPGPEPGVLPLDDPGMWSDNILILHKSQYKLYVSKMCRSTLS